MNKHAILVLLLALTAVFAVELPSPNSTVVFSNIIHVGDKIGGAVLQGVVDECFNGVTIKCTEDGYEVFPCDDGSTEEATDSAAKRELFPCDATCVCGAPIPRDGFFLHFFTGDVCSGIPESIVFGLLDTCISDEGLHYTYTMDGNIFKSISHETETCGGESTIKHEVAIEECNSGEYIVLTNDLDGSVTRWVASLALILISLVVSA